MHPSVTMILQSSCKCHYKIIKIFYPKRSNCGHDPCWGSHLFTPPIFLVTREMVAKWVIAAFEYVKKRNFIRSIIDNLVFIHSRYGNDPTSPWYRFCDLPMFPTGLIIDYARSRYHSGLNVGTRLHTFLNMKAVTALHDTQHMHVYCTCQPEFVSLIYENHSIECPGIPISRAHEIATFYKLDMAKYRVLAEKMLVLLFKKYNESGNGDYLRGIRSFMGCSYGKEIVSRLSEQWVDDFFA